jgi:hypothetical protein
MHDIRPKSADVAETIARTVECGHARKVTRKGGKLKMKFFAPVPYPDERASEVFGLAQIRAALL